MLLTYGGFESHFADRGEDVELQELRTRRRWLSTGSCRAAGSLHAEHLALGNSQGGTLHDQGWWAGY